MRFPCVRLVEQTEHKFRRFESVLEKTRRKRLKSELYLRLKKRKTFLGNRLEIFEFFFFENCRSVPKNVKGGPFLIYKHTFCCKITKTQRGNLGGH